MYGVVADTSAPTTGVHVFVGETPIFCASVGGSVDWIRVSPDGAVVAVRSGSLLMRYCLKRIEVGLDSLPEQTAGTRISLVLKSAVPRRPG